MAVHSAIRRVRREAAVKRIELDKQGDLVKRFFQSLPPDAEGSVVELNGRAVARVVPLGKPVQGGVEHAGPWSEAKNARRCALVDREIDGTLTPEEAAELAILQEQMLRAQEAGARTTRRLAPLTPAPVHQGAEASCPGRDMTALRYPAAHHVRRHGPSGYASAESFRPWLRDEFTCRRTTHAEKREASPLLSAGIGAGFGNAARW
jgi:hypothetical protein